jgi:hypothetical protein
LVNKVKLNLLVGPAKKNPVGFCFFLKPHTRTILTNPKEVACRKAKSPQAGSIGGNS